MSSKTRIEQVPVEDVVVADKRRVPDMNKVKELAASIKEVGLLNPIILRIVDRYMDPDEGEIRGVALLVVGRHRLEAFRLMGEEYVPAIYMKLNDYEAELMEIDENICRSEVSPAEAGPLLLRRKVLYEILHPETAHGATLRSGSAPSCQIDNTGTARFTAETAKVMGVSESVVQKNIARAKALGDDMTKLVGTSLDHGVEMDALRRLPVEQRKPLIERAIAGEKVSARPSRPEVPDTLDECVRFLREHIDRDDLNEGLLPLLEQHHGRVIAAALRRAPS